MIPRFINASIASFAIAAGLSAQSPAVPPVPQIVVSATGEVRVSPDKATINIGAWNGDREDFADIIASLPLRRANADGGTVREAYALTPFC